jgi:uncharacterized membrane protein
MLFHATLKRWAQLADELPMLYLISICFFDIMCIDEKSSTLRKWVSFLISFGVCMVVTLVMFIMPDQPVFFFVAFGIMTFATFVMTLRHASGLEHVTRTWIEATCFLLGVIMWNL